MASEAYGNVEKAMDAAREAELAAYIMRDVELRQQNAKERGVMAYGKKPIPRSVPNRRFLQSTLKSVDFANRSAKEREMWQEWDAQKRPAEVDVKEQKRKRKRARREKKLQREASRRLEGQEDDLSVTSSSSRDEMDEILTRNPARGRGSTGPRADETGPFLFPTDEQEREEYEMMRYARKAAAGPACPDWIREQHSPAESDGSESRERASTQSETVGRGVKLKSKNKSKKKSKSSKREHKKKRRKERDSPS